MSLCVYVVCVFNCDKYNLHQCICLLYLEILVYVWILRDHMGSFFCGAANDKCFTWLSFLCSFWKDGIFCVVGVGVISLNYLLWGHHHLPAQLVLTCLLTWKCVLKNIEAFWDLISHVTASHCISEKEACYQMFIDSSGSTVLDFVSNHCFFQLSWTVALLLL